MSSVLWPHRHLLYIPILGGSAALIQTSVLWVIYKKYTGMPQPQTLFWIAFVVSCFLLVPLVFVTPMRFPFMALVLLLYHHPTYSSSFGVLGLVAMCFAMLYVFAAVWMDEPMEAIPSTFMAVFIVYVVLVVLRRSFFIMARNVWQVRRCFREPSVLSKPVVGLLFSIFNDCFYA